MFIAELRCMIGMRLLTMALRVMPELERVEMASAINPIAKRWVERTADELRAKGIKVDGL